MGKRLATSEGAVERKREMNKTFTPPWLSKPLDEWSIVGMNHYHVNDERYLFVALVKDGRCIIEEGRDDEYLWNRLWHKATAEESQ
jgi:hypothetical protein